MDSFTERILERARERQRKLKQQGVIDDKQLDLQENQPSPSVKTSSSADKTETLPNNSNQYNERKEKDSFESPRKNSLTKFSSDLPGSPQPQLKTLNIQKENFNMEIKLSSSDNIRVEVEIEERDDDDEVFKNAENIAIVENKSSDDVSSLREDTKKRLQRLGKLFAGGDELDISSPIHRTEEKFLSEDADHNDDKENNQVKPTRRGLGKLAALANNINQWEDDITPHKKVSEKCVSPRKKPVILMQNSSNSTSKSGNTPINDCSKPKIVTNSGADNEAVKEAPKTVHWDEKVLKTLESQGFTRTQSNSKLIYNYRETQEQHKNDSTKIKCISENIVEPEKVENEMTPRSPKKTVTAKSAAVANKAAIFESSPKNAKDPALLSVSERKALFEKNKGAAPLPKLPGVPFNVQKPNVNIQINKTNYKSEISKKDSETVSNSQTKKVNEVVKDNSQSNKQEKENVQSLLASPKKAEGIARTMAALLENKTTISQQQIENSIKEQRQKEMDLLLNRFQKNKEVVPEEEKENVIETMTDSDDSEEEEITEKTAMIKEQNKVEIVKRPTISPPPPPPPSGSPRRISPNKRISNSPKVAAVLEDVKRIKVVPPKEGRLYPCLSDIEAATETETELQTASPTPNNSFGDNTSDSGSEINTSFGRELLKQVCKNQLPQKRIFDESTESDISDILNDMDDGYLDEAINYDKSGPTPPKQGRSLSPPLNGSIAQPSNSFNYKSFSPKITPQKSNTNNENMPTHVVDGDNVLPLTHTISFYRRQQSQTPSTPARQIIRQPSLEEHPEAEALEEGVDKKIQALLDEVSKQQTVISQTSQALNLCYSTPEFTGSTEQVEAEKLLLLATHRRQAALHEIQRLKVEGTLRPKSTRSAGFHVEKGTLTISNVVLPLKREYARALAAAGGKGHHIICLVKCDEQVVSTQLVSTVAGSLKNLELELNIPGTIVLENVRGDFTVTFEVYCLQAQEEILPHEVKYHIHKKQGKITPKKPKAENRMIKPPKESPAGPQAVRSPTFALIGYVVLSIQATKKKQWTLNKTPSMSPLEGTIQMNMNYKPQITVKHKGFLTMFEDVSGFGAWHRRWCMLEKGVLLYWKYPDDEKKKEPINCIDLTNCTTEKVGPVSREICARLNTFLIEIERDAQPQDKESLVTIRKGKKTIIRHLLSADTKEERIEWCEAFNKALAALRLSR